MDNNKLTMGQHWTGRGNKQWRNGMVWWGRRLQLKERERLSHHGTESERKEEAWLRGVPQCDICLTQRGTQHTLHQAGSREMKLKLNSQHIWHHISAAAERFNSFRSFCRALLNVDFLVLKNAQQPNYLLVEVNLTIWAAGYVLQGKNN